MNCAPDSLYMEWETSLLSTQLFEPMDGGLDHDLVLALAPEVARGALPACTPTKKGAAADQTLAPPAARAARAPQSLSPASSSAKSLAHPGPHPPPPPAQNTVQKYPQPLAYFNGFLVHPAFFPQSSKPPSSHVDLVPPPGTIFAYCNKRALHLDAPEQRGALGPTRTFSARRTHALVLQTVRREFAVEDRYRRRIARAGYARERVRRRRDLSDYEWKPESVYKTYVDCKPHFFDKTSYQDYIPRSLCFGKINMRIPKAWTRGPNKPKRQKIVPMMHGFGATGCATGFGVAGATALDTVPNMRAVDPGAELGSASLAADFDSAGFGPPLVSDLSSDALISSTTSVLEPPPAPALLAPDFLQEKFLPKFPSFPDELALEMLLL